MKTILNTTNCEYIKENALTKVKHVIYEILYSINVQCPDKLTACETFTCNITMLNPFSAVSGFYNVTVTFSNNSHVTIHLNSTANFFHVEVYLANDGIYELTAIDNNLKLASSKLLIIKESKA